MIFVLVYFLALKGKPVNSFVFIVFILIQLTLTGFSFLSLKRPKEIFKLSRKIILHGANYD